MIHLGYEVPTGRPVEIPVHHMVVVGMTQSSGKTTTLEALVQRGGLTALAFVTKRGEGAFKTGRHIGPYFRDRADWQFVDQLLEAQLREKNKFLRPWIIKLCRTTRTLADVQREVRKAGAKATGFNQGIYTQLEAYLDLIVPEIGRARLAETLELEPGLNVMDVSAYSTPMQMLFVQSAIDWVNHREQGVVVVVPEAWEFIPEAKGSPVKASAVALVRKGGGLGNHIWVDSQDTAGVDKVILRGCTVWLIGVQREANEIKRNLANIPASVKKPRAGDVALLTRGQFFACFEDRLVKVYVQPAWMIPTTALAIARQPHLLKSELATKPEEDDTVTKDEAEKLQSENKRLREEVERLKFRLEGLVQPTDKGGGSIGMAVPEQVAPRRPPPSTVIRVPATLGPEGLTDELYEAIKARLLQDAEKDPAILMVLAHRPELEVQVERRVITIEGGKTKGALARLIAEGFFDSPRTANAAFEEFKRRGIASAVATVYRLADELTTDGFLTKETGGYRAVPGMKVNIVER